MDIELTYKPPSADDIDPLISEHLNMVRLGLAEDRQPGDGDLWAATSGLFDDIKAGSPEELANQLATGMVHRLIAGGVVTANLVRWVARLEGIEPAEVLDRLTLALDRSEDG